MFLLGGAAPVRAFFGCNTSYPSSTANGDDATNFLEADQTGEGQTMVDSDLRSMQFTFLLADAYVPLKGEFLNQTSAPLAACQLSLKWASSSSD